MSCVIQTKNLSISPCDALTLFASGAMRTAAAADARAASNYNDEEEEADEEDSAEAGGGGRRSTATRRRMHALDALLYAGVHTALLSLVFVVLQMWLSYGAAECPKPPVF